MSTIAVLIPTYKPGWYLQRCLQSIEEQTLPKDNFKVYIALNGPKDNFEEVIHSALDSTNFDYEFFYLELASVSNTRNYLIENSAEEYIVFVDDDDVISKNYLEELLKVSDATNIGIANVYNFSESLDDLKGSYIGKSFEKLEKTTSSKYKSRKYFSSPCAKMIHRTIIGNVRFDTELAIGEDSLFMAKISHKVQNVKKTAASACYYVYEREGSATRQKIDKKKELKRIVYLLKEYSKMLLSFRYNTLFIMTRVAATLMHGRRFFW